MNEVVYFDYAELTKAVKAFLKQYLQPSINPNAILWGNQNNVALPAGTNEYCIFYIMNQIRHGTNIERYDPDEETLKVSESSEIIVKVDCYASSENGKSGLNAQIRAHNLELMTRSSVSCEFFKKYGLSPLYADSPIDTTIVSDSNNYLHRWTVNLHLNFTNSLTVKQEGFTEVKPIKPNSIASSPEDIGLHICNPDVKFSNN